jgi:hypothetical protein
VPHIDFWESRCFTKVSDGPKLILFDVLWLQEEGAQIHVCAKPKLHIHKECGLRFHPLLHTFYAVDCLIALLGDDVSSGYYVQ